jgi:hypothetical protein
MRFEAIQTADQNGPSGVCGRTRGNGQNTKLLVAQMILFLSADSHVLGVEQILEVCLIMYVEHRFDLTNG